MVIVAHNLSEMLKITKFIQFADYPEYLQSNPTFVSEVRFSKVEWHSTLHFFLGSGDKSWPGRLLCE